VDLNLVVLLIPQSHPYVGTAVSMHPHVLGQVWEYLAVHVQLGRTHVARHDYPCSVPIALVVNGDVHPFVEETTDCFWMGVVGVGWHEHGTRSFV
jgi:hypothetical protein